MGAYWALFTMGFRRQSTYRAALLTGTVANLFFGVFRSAVFLALYHQRATAGGLDRTGALTYVWLIQVLFGVIFTSWLWEFPEAVRSGAFVSELVRPGDPFARLMAMDLGRTAFAMLFRGLPQLVLVSAFVTLRLPTTPIGIVGLLTSFVLSAAAAFEVRFLFGSTAFWTADFRGWWSLLFGLVWVGAGMVVPIELFPHAARVVAEHSPLAVLLALPVRVATGRGVAAALGLQLWWTVTIGAVCWLVMGVAQRRAVIHGG